MDYWDFEQEVDEAVRVGLIVIGQIARAARLQRGLTQRQLAWRTGLSQSTISKLETGRLRGMRLHTLAAIIGVLRSNPNGVASPGWRSTTHRADEPPPPTRRLPGQADADEAQAA